jgi:hypothetical protein
MIRTPFAGAEHGNSATQTGRVGPRVTTPRRPPTAEAAGAARTRPAAMTTPNARTTGSYRAYERRCRTGRDGPPSRTVPTDAELTSAYGVIALIRVAQFASVVLVPPHVASAWYCATKQDCAMYSLAIQTVPPAATAAE